MLRVLAPCVLLLACATGSVPNGRAAAREELIRHFGHGTWRRMDESQRDCHLDHYLRTGRRAQVGDGTCESLH